MLNDTNIYPAPVARETSGALVGKALPISLGIHCIEVRLGVEPPRHAVFRSVQSGRLSGYQIHLTPPSSWVSTAASHKPHFNTSCFLQKQETGLSGLQPAVVTAHLLQSVLFRSSVWSGHHTVAGAVFPAQSELPDYRAG